MVSHLGPRFRMHGMQRPRISATVSRPDGLFMAISRAWEVVHEADLSFEDAAGRCPQVRGVQYCRRQGWRREDWGVCWEFFFLGEGRGAVRAGAPSHPLTSFHAAVVCNVPLEFVNLVHSCKAFSIFVAI
jgi:hypothetical protein